MDKQVKILTRDKGREWPDMVKVMLSSIWAASDKSVKVTVEEYAETRRLAQNKLLFLWHGELSKHIEESTGHVFDSDDIHEHVAEKLLPKRVVAIDGEQPVIVRTKTSKLKVEQFSEFLGRYDRWAMGRYKCKFTHPDDLYLRAVMQDAK